jgi:hypothetical protein
MITDKHGAAKREVMPGMSITSTRENNRVEKPRSLSMASVRHKIRAEVVPASA